MLPVLDVVVAVSGFDNAMGLYSATDLGLDYSMILFGPYSFLLSTKPHGTEIRTRIPTG